MQYFEIFNLESEYIIDPNDLEKKYLLLQKQYHPDNASNTEFEQQEMMRFAMLINDAYKTLQNPVARAEYILNESNHGISSDEQRYQLPIEDLQFFLEEQENIDAINNVDQYNSKLISIEKHIKTEINNIAASWKLRAMPEMQYHSCMLKYLYNLKQYLDSKENYANN